MVDDINSTINKEVNRITGGANAQDMPRRLGKVDGLVKKSAYQKFKEVLFEEDIHTVGEGLLADVVIPTVKNFFADIMIGGIERALFGESRRGSNRNGYRNYSTSSVQTVTRSSLNEPTSARSARRDAQSGDWQNIVMRSKDKADAVVSKLKDAVYMDGEVSLWQLYDIVSEEDGDFLGSTDYTTRYWGWTDLSGSRARYRRVATGWLIVLPEPIQLPLKVNSTVTR